MASVNDAAVHTCPYPIASEKTDPHDHFIFGNDGKATEIVLGFVEETNLVSIEELWNVVSWTPKMRQLAKVEPCP
jgi:hypothetical protein